MQVNHQKSHFIFNCDDEEVCRNIYELFPVSKSKIKDGFEYLGFHLKPNSYKCVDWLWLVKRFEKRIKVWLFKFLSLDGRFVLASSILQSIVVSFACISH